MKGTRNNVWEVDYVMLGGGIEAEPETFLVLLTFGGIADCGWVGIGVDTEKCDGF